MGFDLYGINPKIKEDIPKDWSKPEAEEFCKRNVGYYFRANVWCWRPIWEIVGNFCYPKILTDAELESGYYNNQGEIKEEKALAIAERLDTSILNGHLINYIEQINDSVKQLPDECCSICKGKGVRKNELIKSFLVEGSHLLDEGQPEGVVIECNCCQGKGKVRPFILNYYYDIDPINRFIRFCKNSGGFIIS